MSKSYLIGFTNGETTIISAKSHDDAVSIGIMLAMERGTEFAFAREM